MILWRIVDWFYEHQIQTNQHYRSIRKFQYHTSLCILRPKIKGYLHFVKYGLFWNQLSCNLVFHSSPFGLRSNIILSGIFYIKHEYYYFMYKNYRLTSPIFLGLISCIYKLYFSNYCNLIGSLSISEKEDSGSI